MMWYYWAWLIVSFFFFLINYGSFSQVPAESFRNNIERVFALLIIYPCLAIIIALAWPFELLWILALACKEFKSDES